MGMAASQARLLTLTARLSDVELKAQNIQSQKIQLATQEDEVYQNYCEALDATKIQIAFQGGTGVTKSYVDANFSNMCLYDKDRMTDYALTDGKTGKILVTQEIKDMYEQFQGDKYLFALGMMGLDDVIKNDLNRPNSYIGDYSDNEWSNGKTYYSMTAEEADVYNELTKDGNNPGLKALHETYQKAVLDNAPIEEQRTALKNFRDKLYELGKADIYNKMANKTGKDFPKDLDTEEFNFYIHLFEKIQSAGGCTVIDPAVMNGSDGNDWLNEMVTSGRVTISVYNKTSHEWNDTSLATSTQANYLQEGKDDIAVKKAEAEYEYKMKKISSKDKKFDQDLSKLETERNSITKEIESLKTVRDDNITRTFDIFKS